MSRLYKNIKYLCKANAVNIADIEKPMKAGYISRYERRDAILSLPLWIVIRVSKKCNVSIDDLIEKDIAQEHELRKVRNEIERLKEIEHALTERSK